MITYIVYLASPPLCILVYLSKSFMLAHNCLFVWFFSGCVTLSRFACLFIVGWLCFQVFSFCQQCTSDFFSIRVEVMKVEIQTQRVYTQVPSAPAELLIPSILSPKRPPNWIFGSLIFCSMREVGFI